MDSPSRWRRADQTIRHRCGRLSSLEGGRGLTAPRAAKRQEVYFTGANVGHLIPS
jgi:hypothetical protein